MRHPSVSIAASLLVAAALLGCEPDGHVLSVDLQSDLVAGAEVVLVETVLETANGGVPQRRMQGALKDAPLFDGMRVADFEGLATGPYVVRVALRAADGRTLATRTVDLVLTQSFAVTVVVTRSCVSVECGDGLTCQDGDCVSTRCTVESPEDCPEPACAADTDCEAPAASCAVARCRGGSCFQVPPDVSMCALDEYCIPETSCTRFPAIATDAGPRDAGPIDAGPPDAGPLDAGDAAPTEAPVLRLPARGEWISGGSPKLSWWWPARATFFQLAVATDPAFDTADVVHTELALTSDFIYVGGLPEGRLYWRVRACNANGCGPHGDALGSFWYGRSRLDLEAVPDGVAETIIGTQQQDGFVAVHEGALPATHLGRPSEVVPGIGGFGTALAVGDFDGDGDGELAVGAPRANYSATHQGEVSVFEDGVGMTGSDTSPELLLVLHGPTGPAPTSELLFGWSLVVPGDLDADGYDDLVVGQPRDPSRSSERGSVVVFFGSPTGLSEASHVLLTSPGTGGPDEFGVALAGGDVNGDASVDLVVGAPRADSSAGRLYFYPGGPSARTGGLSSDSFVRLPLGAAIPGEELGRALAFVRDVNHDGLGDVLVGAPESDGGVGRVVLAFGSADGPGQNPVRAFEVFSPSSPLVDGHFGRVVSGGADIDGNGAVDFVIAAPDRGAGEVYLYRNPTAPWSAPAPEAVLPEGTAEARYGACLALTADRDGDELADLVIGHPGSVGSGTVVDPDGEIEIHDGEMGAPPTVLLTIPGPTGGGTAMGGACL